MCYLKAGTLSHSSSFNDKICGPWSALKKYFMDFSLLVSRSLQWIKRDRVYNLLGMQNPPFSSPLGGEMPIRDMHSSLILQVSDPLILLPGAAVTYVSKLEQFRSSVYMLGFSSLTQSGRSPRLPVMEQKKLGREARIDMLMEPLWHGKKQQDWGRPITPNRNNVIVEIISGKEVKTLNKLIRGRSRMWI